MAKKARRKAQATARIPQGLTTLIFGEEGIHVTTLVFGEEHINPTTFIVGEEGPTIHVGEHPSLPIAENPPSVVSAELGPIFDPGGPVEAQAKVAARRRSRKK